LSTPLIPDIGRERKIAAGLGKGIKIGVASEFETIKPGTEEGVDSTMNTLRNMRVVSSYSWMDKDTMAIKVPDSPPVIKEVKLPLKISKYTGIYYVDLNAYCSPQAPFAPLISAINHLEPNYKWPDVDIISDRCCLLKLIYWLSGQEFNPGGFRMDLQLAGTKTLFINRWEGRNIRRSPNKWRESFDEVYTDASGALGHYRIVEYELNGLKTLMRYDVGGCLPPNPQQEEDGPKEIELSPTGQQLTSRKDPIPKFVSLVNVIPSGSLVPQDRIVEMKIRKKGARKYLNDANLMLLLSQTTHFQLAFHRNGKFNKITTHELGKDELDRTNKQTHAISKLHLLLHAIRMKMLRANAGKDFSLICDNSVLTLHKDLSGSSWLPEDHLALFDRPSK